MVWILYAILCSDNENRIITMQTISQIAPIPSTFSLDVFPILSTDSSSMNFQTGIPSTFSIPIDSGGVYITRAMMNGLARIITSGQYLSECGNINTFDANVSSAIGGYPQYAILDYFDQAFYVVRKVRSLIENNTYNFVESPNYIDDEHWKFVDNIKTPTTLFSI